MCKASKYLSDIDKLIADINLDIQKLNKKKSEYDRLINEQYHKIEQANFNACEGYYLAKQLQETLRKRRLVKDEFNRLDTLKETLDRSQIKNNISKTKSTINHQNQKSCKWQRDWKYTYTLEEVLN